MRFLETALDLIRQSGINAVSVVYREVGGSEEWAINAETVFHAASTMKIGVMMEVFRQAHMGRFALDDRITVANEFTSIADAQPFSLAASDDADPEIYEFVGRQATIRDLTHRMIVRSSNLATNVLLGLVGASATQEFMTRLGSPDVVILRGVEDKAAYRAGLNNTVTARGLAHLLTKLARREVVSPRDSDAMLDILLGQELNEGIPEGLATETPFAHKTGWNDVAYHDAGVIDPYGPSPQVLVILTTGRGDMEAGGAFVAELARVLIGRG